MPKRIAIQGVKGCFHEQAARLFYKDLTDIEIIECDNFEDLYLAMDSGKADAAIMAIENTVSGGLLPNFELLRKYQREIKGETYRKLVEYAFKNCDMVSFTEYPDQNSRFHKKILNKLLKCENLTKDDLIKNYSYTRRTLR